jgi:hypothetical protein
MTGRSSRSKEIIVDGDDIRCPYLDDMPLGETGPRLWSEKEEMFMRKYYPTHKPKYLAEVLPGRSICSIRAKAMHMGLRKAEGYRR